MMIVMPMPQGCARLLMRPKDNRQPITTVGTLSETPTAQESFHNVLKRFRRVIVGQSRPPLRHHCPPQPTILLASDKTLGSR